MPPMEVDRVRMSALVDEAHSQSIAFSGANGRSRNLSVVGPRRKDHARCDFNLTIDRENLELAEHRPIGSDGLPVKATAFVGRQIIEVPGPRVPQRIESHRCHPADGAEQVGLVSLMTVVWDGHTLPASGRAP